MAYPFHGVKDGLGCNYTGRLFKNLLVASLDGAVTAVKTNRLAVLISQQLHLQVAHLFHALHHEDR